MATATEAATLIIEQVPAGRPPNPETYIASIVSILAEYPPELVAKISDPVHGVVRKTGFLPNLKELSEALEAEMLPLRRRWRQVKEQRDFEEKHRLVVTDEAAKQRVAEACKKASEQLTRSSGPVPFMRDGTPPVGTSAGGAVAKVLADIANRKINPTNSME